MNEDILKELIQELHNETKKIVEGHKILTNALELNTRKVNKFEEFVRKAKFSFSFDKMNEYQSKHLDYISELIQTGLETNVKISKKIQDKVLNWRKVFEIGLKVFFITAISLVILISACKLYIPVIKENLKYKNAYEYLYYSNISSQNYLQETILKFDNKKSKQKLMNKTRKLKEESTNPLVFSK